MHGIGIVGLGVMGRRMAAAMEAHPAFRVITGYDPFPSQDLGGIALTDSPADVIADPAVDCVYIAAPPAAHLDFVAAAAASGKTIFCEKPLAASPDDAYACVTAVANAGVPAAVNFPLATAQAAVRLRHLVAAGALGEVRKVKLTLRFARWPRSWQAGAADWLARPEQGGFMREVGSHFLFLAHRLFGPGTVREMRVERGSAGTETAVQGVIAYRSVALTIDASVGGEAEDFNRFEVAGTHGTAALTDWYRLEHAGALSDRVLPGVSQLDGLARLLAGDPNQPLASFEEAAAVVGLVETLLAASADRRT